MLKTRNLQASVVNEEKFYRKMKYFSLGILFGIFGYFYAVTMPAILGHWQNFTHDPSLWGHFVAVHLLAIGVFMYFHSKHLRIRNGLKSKANED
jgi:hypothetical protein